MGLFKKKKKVPEKPAASTFDEVYEWGIKNAQSEEERRYYEAQADKQYQAAQAEYCALLTEIKETYTVINNVSSFSSEAGDRLLDRCVEGVNMENYLSEKWAYYDSAKHEYSEPHKMLSMIYEKRGDYQRAASVCVLAIQKGFTKDGTNGGMRGRLARMIKKGNLPISDQMKEILNL